MAFRYRLVVLIYALALFPALLMLDCGSPPIDPRCHWGMFGVFEGIVPTIIAAMFLLVAWVIRPGQRRI